MKKILVLAASVLALAGCDIDGTLSVQQPLTMKAKNNEVLTLQPGSYKTSVENDDNTLKIRIKVGNKEKKISLKPSNGQKIPQKNGPIFIGSETSGQAFDLNGAINTETQSGPQVRAVQNCTAYYPVYSCRDVIVGYDRYGRPIFSRQCSNEMRPVPGHENVVYHVDTTTVDVNMAFQTPHADNVLGRFEGQRSNSKTVYEYRGGCIADYGYPYP